MKVTVEQREMYNAGMSIGAIADKTGVAKTTLSDAIKRAGMKRRPGTTIQKRPRGYARARNAVPVVKGHDKAAFGKTIAEFRATYDKSYIVPAKIKATIKELGNGWEYETTFAKMAGVSLADLGSFRDEFAAHVISLREGRRVWAGTKAIADQMRQMI